MKSPEGSSQRLVNSSCRSAGRVSGRGGWPPAPLLCAVLTPPAALPSCSGSLAAAGQLGFLLAGSLGPGRVAQAFMALCPPLPGAATSSAPASCHVAPSAPFLTAWGTLQTAGRGIQRWVALYNEKCGWV